MYEEERILTVGTHINKITKITLQGHWLNALGYTPRKKVSVKIIKENGVAILNISLIN